ncbi:MAG: acyltransferase [Betaproteobacteria bacterium]|nr:acyltransferase [Betaproteobacteria bacterium]
MRYLLQKLHICCATPRDFLCLLVIRGQIWWSAFWGTLGLRCKAALLGIECGSGVRAAGAVILARWPKSRIHIGAGASLVSCSRRATAAVVAPVRLKTLGPEAAIVLEQGVELSGTSIAARSKTIHIGAHTMIAPGCVLVDSDFHAPWPPERRHIDPGYDRDAGIEIGDHVWIGMRCCILKGVRIGRGSIVAAGSIVVHDVPENCLAAGVPARVVRAFGKEDFG